MKPYTVQHIDLTNLCMHKTEAEQHAQKLQDKFGGRTYMNLEFFCYPIGGSFNVAVRGKAQDKEELQGMVMSIFTSELMGA